MKLKIAFYIILITLFLVVIGTAFSRSDNYVYKLIHEKITNVFNNIYDNSHYQGNVNSEIIYPEKDIIITSKPLIYIYNTHENEAYSNVGYEETGINPSVKDASFLLQKYLSNHKIEAVVEENSFIEMLNINNWPYESLYQVSRFYLENAIKRYEDVKLYIDLHRDSIKKSESTIEIDGLKYAKILFVIGISHDKYEENLKNTKTLNEIIVSKANISRGILKKTTNNANGIYNQDLKNNVILVEIGGYQNSYEEVSNTLKILAESIKDYIEAKNG